MISRGAFIAGVTAIVMARRADAQSTAKVYRVGMLGVDRRPTNEQLAPGVIASKLRELGWEEGRNLSIDYRFTESPDAMPQLSTSLIASKPDVLVALGPFPAHALKDATQTIPIVLAAVADPVGRGLVPSLARPGGNITGVSHYVGSSMGGKPAELLKEFVPRTQRLAWLINPANPIYRTGALERTIDQVNKLKVSVHRMEARSAAELPAAFEAAVRARVDGLVVTADSLFNSERDTIVKFAAKQKLPAWYPHRWFVDGGGLISYGANFLEVYRRVAVYVDKILRGAKPADLPIEQPTTFEMVVNLKTAKALGLTVPPSVLLRADQVIE
jgi:putative ABC transport system substrate-binding protein